MIFFSFSPDKNILFLKTGTFLKNFRWSRSEKKRCKTIRLRFLSLPNSHTEEGPASPWTRCDCVRVSSRGRQNVKGQKGGGSWLCRSLPTRRTSIKSFSPFIPSQLRGGLVMMVLNPVKFSIYRNDRSQSSSGTWTISVLVDAIVHTLPSLGGSLVDT